MEFPKLIQKGKSKGKSSKKPSIKVWQIKTKTDNSKNEIILITESGDLGGRMITRQKKMSNINLSSKNCDFSAKYCVRKNERIPTTGSLLRPHVFRAEGSGIFPTSPCQSESSRRHTIRVYCIREYLFRKCSQSFFGNRLRHRLLSCFQIHTKFVF